MERAMLYRPLLSRYPPADRELFTEVIHAAISGGAISSQEGVWMNAIMELGRLQMRTAIVPRVDVVAVPEDCHIDQAARLMSEHGRRRLPVYRASIDQPVGVLHSLDVARSLATPNDGEPRPTSGDLARAATSLPESLPLLDGFEAMRRDGTHLALIADDHGGLAGLVTIEDILEQIVGPIPDEYGDDARHSVRLTGAGEAIVGAAARLHELELLFNLELPDEKFASVGGLVYEALGRIPRPGDVVDAAGLQMEVLSMDGVRLGEVRVRVARPDGSAAAPHANGEAPFVSDPPDATREGSDAAATSTARTLELPIGAEVRCGDRIVGQLERLVVDPSSGNIVQLVLGREDGSFLMPIDAVADERDDFVYLRPAYCDLEKLERYDPSEYVAAGKEGIGRGRQSGDVVYRLNGRSAAIRGRQVAARGMVALPGDRGGVEVTEQTEVRALDGPAGYVDHVLLDPASGSVTDIVVRRGSLPLFPERAVIVPVGWIRSVTPEHLDLGVRVSDLDLLPEFRPDESVEDDLIQRLNNDPRFQGVDFYTLHVEVKAGVVYLTGNVRSRELAQAAEAHAWATPGVLEVRNELVTDEDLTEKIEQVILADGRFKDCDLQIEVDQGVVRLSGHVWSPEQREALTDLVEEFPGVLGVRSVVKSDSVSSKVGRDSDRREPSKEDLHESL
jgi:Mg2+/Co2+ transporter CorC/osmotically-inducible protein OsmY/sporulation protein YlmC with PRC-barrel domain